MKDTKVTLLNKDLIQHNVGFSIEALKMPYNNDSADEKLLHYVTLVKRHASLLEYIKLFFKVEGISYRSHVYLIRHRLHTATVRSQRFAPVFTYMIPEHLEGEALDEYKKVMQENINRAESLKENYSIQNDTMIMAMPQGVKVTMVYETNLRQLLHVFKLRLAPDAHYEIRSVVQKMIDTIDNPFIMSALSKLGFIDS